ncbi:alpha-ribazole phosphatase [Leptobacterium flavescens]|uniref:Alpha-ribazole phosphatase n=1 Tax=Leptobacterium flavescens TaxID=472055 RepID=A0A6P0UHQ0_9FLAO|nr:alpha-ribazole phosphatase [Leptobacterium flavescens]NER11980.1 alpha-ribazole phosphatase [Leptobacterium flavescens]
MEIYLIRHTTPRIEKGTCYGQADLELEETFKQEAGDVLSRITMSPDNLIYSSPLKRCYKLAEKIGSTIITDKRLMELNFGEWELKNWDAINKKELDKWMTDFVDEIVPGGESYTQLASRSISFLNEVMQKQDTNVIIVTHAGVIRALLSHILRIELKDSFQIKLTYGDVIKLKKEEGNLTVVSKLSIRE